MVEIPSPQTAAVRVTCNASLPDDLLRRFDTPGPRYTSYPTADRFGSAFGPKEAGEALSHRGTSARAVNEPLSVYVHVPFCESLCYYCACNKVITKHHERAAEYIGVLEAELDLVVSRLGRSQVVSQLHLGGGSPTFLSDDELRRVVDALNTAFAFSPDIEASIEVDPRTVDATRLLKLRMLGFNRLSFGVQDFDTAVQKAVHRMQPYDDVAALMQAARSLGFRSINTDLIYGLPKQTPDTFARTIEQVGALRPDRVALYAYAHLPTRFKPQRRILAEDLPTPGQRIEMLGAAIQAFFSRGYEYIGMDHFALADDSLAVAKREGRLQRNFQGYSTHKDCDLIGLGPSAIGRIGAAYYQNARTLAEYYAAVRTGQLPVVRGALLTLDDQLRRSIIMDLMCQGAVDFETIERTFGVSVPIHFESEIRRLAAFAADGLVKIDAKGIEVTATGRYMVRAIAMVFDAYVESGAPRERFSRVI